MAAMAEGGLYQVFLFLSLMVRAIFLKVTDNRQQIFVNLYCAVFIFEYTFSQTVF